jgi:hypothetical protein
MIMESFLSMIKYLSAREDDDVADRLNYLYTPNILLAFSVLISFKQFGGRMNLYFTRLLDAFRPD